MQEYKTRKAFMAANEAKGENDSWNWSWVNHKEKFVVFGLAELNVNNNGRVILSENWKTNPNGRKKSGYTQAIEHINLVENHEYALKTFPVVFSDLKFKLHGGPMEIESFTSELTTKLLEKRGRDWVAIQTDESAAITAEVAKSIMGDKLYQERARAAIPILVRQARARQTISYEDLAAELGMANPQNLNYVLGGIAETLIALGKHGSMGGSIPPIQCVAVSKKEGLPGSGLGIYIEDLKDYETMSRVTRRELVNAKLIEIYDYPRWHEVLEFLDLMPCRVPELTAQKFIGGGEGPEHKALKQFVAENPSVVKLPKNQKHGEPEWPLPSGDSVDVMFNTKDGVTAVEVKSFKSGDADIKRGLFQCVKYQAVLEAWLKVEGAAGDVRTVLVLGGDFPEHLLSLKNTLGVEVIDGVRPE